LAKGTFADPSTELPAKSLAVVHLAALPALPVTLPVIGLVTVKLPSVPTDVNEEATTLLAKVVPVNVPASAAADMVISAVPSKLTPLIVLAVCNAVAVAALPVTLPAIGLVTVKLPSVPTDVNEEVTTLLAKVVPVSVPAAAGTVMFAEPSKLTPLIVLGVASVVAVPALPVTLPAIGLVTVKLPSVPTEVKEEFTKDAGNVVADELNPPNPAKV